MGVVIRAVIAGLLRYLLFAVSAWAIKNGIATPEQVELLIVGASGLIVSTSLLVYLKYRERFKFLTALAAPSRTSELEVTLMMKDGEGVRPGERP